MGDQENKEKSPLALNLKSNTNKQTTKSGLGGGLKSKKGVSIQSYLPKGSQLEAFFNKKLATNPLPLTKEVQKAPQSYGPYIPRKTGADYIRDIPVEGVYFDNLFEYQEQQP